MAVNDTLVKSLFLDPLVPAPARASVSGDQILVKVINASINPTDYSTSS